MGYRVVAGPARPDGTLDIDAVARLLHDDEWIVSIAAASHQIVGGDNVTTLYTVLVGGDDHDT